MKILFSDLDGTLLKDGKTITPYNRERLLKFQEAGHRVGLCTGRSLLEMKALLSHEALPYDYMILNNGGHILDCYEHTLYEKKIAHAIGVKVILMALDVQGMWVTFCDGAKSYTYHEGQTYDHSVHPEQLVNEDFFSLLKSAGDFQIISINKDRETLNEVHQCADEIMHSYGNEVNCHKNEIYVDIVPAGCSKATGIRELENHVQESFDRIYTIGDSYNDLPMILEGDVGCTFTYAQPEIQSQAAYVYDYEYELIDDILGEKIE